MADIAAASNLANNLDHPMGPFLYTVSLMHCMPAGLINGGTGLGMMFRNGEWGKIKTFSSEFVDIHIAATALLYGQQAFEGMKAYRGPDKKIRL